MGDKDDIVREEVSAEVLAINGGLVKNADCGTLEMTQSGAGLVTTTGDVSLDQAGAGAIVTDADARLFQSGSGVVVSNRAEVVQGFVGVLASQETEFSADSRVLMTTKEAAVFAAVFGVITALVDLAFRGLFRRRR